MSSKRQRISSFVNLNTLLENCFYTFKALSSSRLVGCIPNAIQTHIAAHRECFLHNQTKIVRVILYLAQ